jgi:hypothetical protein
MTWLTTFKPESVFYRRVPGRIIAKFQTGNKHQQRDEPARVFHALSHTGNFI